LINAGSPGWARGSDARGSELLDQARQTVSESQRLADRIEPLGEKDVRNVVKGVADEMKNPSELANFTTQVEAAIARSQMISDARDLPKQRERTPGRDRTGVNSTVQIKAKGLKAAVEGRTNEVERKVGELDEMDNSNEVAQIVREIMDLLRQNENDNLRLTDIAEDLETQRSNDEVRIAGERDRLKTLADQASTAQLHDAMREALQNLAASAADLSAPDLSANSASA